MILDEQKKRLTFLGIVGVLMLGIFISVFYVNLREPPPVVPNGGTTVVDGQKKDGKIVIKDVNDGEMPIPAYNIPKSSYDLDEFTAESGIVSYQGVTRIGISVRQDDGDIDWNQVSASGVKFAMIRAGFRGRTDGKIYSDSKFAENVEGAIAAGISVGVYFTSRAISETEAEEEADVVLQKIQEYQITYPVVFSWAFSPETPLLKGAARSEGCSPGDVTRFTGAFCKKVKKEGYHAMFQTDKQMGYEFFNLQDLKDYDIWYVEYKKQPAFHYNFNMWQYSSEGQVAGIDAKVKMNYSFVDYATQ